MTDQDPTQAYQPPEAQPPAAEPPAPPAAEPPAPPASAAFAPPPASSYAPPASSYAPPAAFAAPEPAHPGTVPSAPYGAYPGTEPAAEPVATSPVAATAAPRAGRSRVKWLVAAVVTLLVAGTAAGATLLLTGSSAASPVTGWAPADTVSYTELRLDLPGNQRTELAKFMSAFPGFDDQAAFPTKLAEIGDKIVRAASKDKHGYQSEIAPWFAGDLAVAQGPTPSMDSMKSGTFDFRALVIIHVSDAAKATAWVDGILKETDSKTTTETYGGATITVIETGSQGMGIEMPKVGYTVLDKVLLAGDLTSVRAAIDTKGTGGLSAKDSFKAAQAALPSDRLAFTYADYKATLQTSFDSLKSLSSDATGMVDGLIGVYDKMLPPWLAGSVRAADGRLVMESVMPHVAALGPASNKADVIAGMAPADTVFLATGHDLGARLKTVRGMFDAEPAFKDVLAQVDKAMGIVGGFDAATGWIGDFGIVITRQGAAVDGGVIIAPTNAGDANRLLTSIRSLVEVGAGSSLTFGEESYAGTTIVTLDLSSLANLGAAMGGGESSGIPSDLKLAWAVSDNVVVMGVGPQFVKDVLDARSGESLAKQARYSSLVNAAGAQNSGVIWVDPTAIRGMVEPLLPADAKSSYEKDLKPYLEPFDAVVGVTVAGDSLDRVTVYLTVTP